MTSDIVEVEGRLWSIADQLRARYCETFKWPPVKPTKFHVRVCLLRTDSFRNGSILDVSAAGQCRWRCGKYAVDQRGAVREERIYAIDVDCCHARCRLGRNDSSGPFAR